MNLKNYSNKGMCFIRFKLTFFMKISETKKPVPGGKLVEVDDEESGKAQRKRQNIIK